MIRLFPFLRSPEPRPDVKSAEKVTEEHKQSEAVLELEKMDQHLKSELARIQQRLNYNDTVVAPRRRVTDKS